jgi:hypothetical protein
MYAYSSWVLTNASPASVTAFADGIGDPGRAEVLVQDDRLIQRAIQYDDVQDSPWDVSNTHGQWVIGVVDLGNRDEFGSRLVGVITPSAPMTEHLSADLADHLQADMAEHETVVFSLRALLRRTSQQEDTHPSSVRLLDGSTRILIQSNDESTLLETLAGLPGDPVGVTMKTDEGNVTVTAQGPVIFTDSMSPAGVLDSMRLIAQAAIVNMTAGA